MFLRYRPPDHCMAKQLMMVKKSPKKFYDFTKGGTDIVDQLNDYYTTRSKSCRWVMVALSYMLHTARANGKNVWCLKNDSSTAWKWYFKHSFVWRQLEFGKSLGSFTCTAKKFEWLGIQREVENKDVSWNSGFSRWASTKSREKIHRNRTKEKMSITHNQLPHKDGKGQCPKFNWTVPIIWYQYFPGTFNASLPWLLTMKFCFIFHIHFA